MHGFMQDFFVRGRGGKCGHWPIVLSQILLFVIKCICFLCMNEKNKTVELLKMML